MLQKSDAGSDPRAAGCLLVHSHSKGAAPSQFLRSTVFRHSFAVFVCNPAGVSHCSAVGSAGHPRSCPGVAERSAAPLGAVLAHGRAVGSTAAPPQILAATLAGADPASPCHGVAYSCPAWQSHCAARVFVKIGADTKQAAGHRQFMLLQDHESAHEPLDGLHDREAGTAATVPAAGQWGNRRECCTRHIRLARQTLPC